ncbi:MULTISPECIES: STAS domain-containing protein [Pseudomonas]|uniref:STAS domain-containing protein n=1 Tax=Pseudomonas TaxID=286 RepID=UPI001C7E9FDA|nr:MULTISPECIES: STAS domain-containing protein [Pseudomonas]MDG9927545.1 STAS domain-containing protein [Pseudomonas sp. GD04042]MDH0484474.1 STAS domain-containing protein [Pseudomonas sp. GD04015]MDH0602966.1 STAS domain-containing protein [Pseudomonas sp. GD03869]
MSVSVLAELLKQNEQNLLEKWMAAQRVAGIRVDLIDENTVEENSRELIKAFIMALAQGSDSIEDPAWKPLKAQLERLSVSQARQGFSPSETATFVFSLKEPLFDLIQNQGEKAIELVWLLSKLIDKLGLFSLEYFMAGRELVIREQQESLLELSTPVVQLWDGVLAVPLIGALDSNRTQIVMEALLEKIVETESDIAIIDITGVPTVDTMVAQHLLKTITAAKLMGAKCIISGIRPQIAATIVHLGVELGDVVTKASLVDAFKLALKELNVRMTRVEKTR